MDDFIGRSAMTAAIAVIVAAFFISWVAGLAAFLTGALLAVSFVFAVRSVGKE